MITTPPKPRAGEHTPDTDAAQAGCGHLDWAAKYGYMSEFARELEAERDLLRERERELVEALGRMVNAYDIAYQRGIVLPEDCAESKYARSVLTKVHA